MFEIVTRYNRQNISLSIVHVVECVFKVLTFIFSGDIILVRKGLFSLTETTRGVITAAESIVFDETILSAAIFIEVLKCKRKLI